jgi:hypothetical protein
VSTLDANTVSLALMVETESSGKSIVSVYYPTAIKHRLFGLHKDDRVRITGHLSSTRISRSPDVDGELLELLT